MPNKLQKSLQDYLSKIKTPHLSISSSKKWILSGCKHPKSPSFAIDTRHEAHGGCGGGSNNNNNNNNNDAATLSDVDRFLFENFKSLYLRDDDDNSFNPKTFSKENHDAPKLGPILFDSPRFLEPPPDLCGSNRFFVNPGLSGALVEDPFTSLTTTCDEGGSSSTSTTFNDSSSNSHDHHHSKEAMETLPHNCIAVLAYSPSPFEDFRRSMLDIVEARFKNHQRVDWDFMEELLFGYLNLNDKKSYKFILSAFVDLIVVLRQRSERVPPKPQSVRTFRIGREMRRKKMKEVTFEFGPS